MSGPRIIRPTTCPAWMPSHEKVKSWGPQLAFSFTSSQSVASTSKLMVETCKKIKKRQSTIPSKELTCRSPSPSAATKEAKVVRTIYGIFLKPLMGMMSAIRATTGFSAQGEMAAALSICSLAAETRNSPKMNSMVLVTRPSDTKPLRTWFEQMTMTISRQEKHADNCRIHWRGSFVKDSPSWELRAAFPSFAAPSCPINGVLNGVRSS
mmetsp:Transcript_24219/g.68662  ORF Transcript_24219/g.68662 Transcript_24219/m.68662 type:complete len:209 (-) Transcript_24219:169-795(-)